MYDFGSYSEVVLMYDDYILNRWDENTPDKFNRFWNWFNMIEGVDLETEAITSAIKTSYVDTIRAADEKY